MVRPPRPPAPPPAASASAFSSASRRAAAASAPTIRSAAACRRRRLRLLLLLPPRRRRLPRHIGDARAPPSRVALHHRRRPVECRAPRRLENLEGAAAEKDLRPAEPELALADAAAREHRHRRSALRLAHRHGHLRARRQAVRRHALVATVQRDDHRDRQVIGEAHAADAHSGDEAACINLPLEARAVDVARRLPVVGLDATNKVRIVAADRRKQRVQRGSESLGEAREARALGRAGG